MNALIRTVGKPKLLLLPMPLQALRIHSPGYPEGGRHGCRPFSDQAMDGLSENGDGTTHALSDVDVTRKVLSLVTFFAPAKKVTRLQAKALDFESRSENQDRCATRLGRAELCLILPTGGERQHLSPTGELLFFAGAKKSNQKKAPSPTNRSSLPSCCGHFRTRHPCLDPKTAAIHGGRPPGVRMDSRLVACGKSKSKAGGFL